MLAPRDPTSILEALDAATADLVIACTPPSPRGIPASEVATAAAALGCSKPVLAVTLHRALRALAKKVDA